MSTTRTSTTRTYIPCSLSPATEQAARDGINPRKMVPFGTLSKTSLRSLLADERATVEFISRSLEHRDGAWFTIKEALRTYGPVGLEVRNEHQQLIAMVCVDADGSVVVR